MRVKKPNSVVSTRHSRESGNPLRRFRKENRVDIAGGRLRIPAFAGMTKYYWRVIVFCRAEPFGAPTAIVKGILANTRHSRESGNLFAALLQREPGRYCGRRLRIPAFAGMTKYY